jgi:histidyl-tRNA synthetase
MNSKSQTLKGFRDFLPEEARKRAWLKAKMVEVFEKWGYQPLETPTLEPLELFQGQIGEDEKLFYKFKDQGDRDVALRYDQTVPTCRVIGQYFNQIVFPFRRYQIQSAFRAEKPQSGRFREFTQSDLDIFGVASPLADAEIIAATLDLYKTLGFKRAVALINSRDLLSGIPYPAIAAIDKLQKIGPEGVVSEMVAKGISKAKAQEYLNTVRALKPNEDLKQIFNYLKESGFPEDWYKFEPTLARSFSYSQGPIWEITIPEYATGSVGGGERYDKLVETISGQKVPATGIGIGFDRTLEALEACQLLPKFESISKVLVTVFSPKLMLQSIKVVNLLKQNNINAEIYPDPNIKLDKQLKYANRRLIPYVIIIGPDELKTETVVLKNMVAAYQEKLPLKSLVKNLK